MQLLLHILCNVMCFAIMQDDELGRRSTVSFFFLGGEKPQEFKVILYNEFQRSHLILK